MSTSLSSGSLIALGALASLALAFPASAATITLSPSAVSVTEGKVFTIVVDVVPEGANLYTVKAGLSYPAALLQATGFTIDSTWPLSAPGNSINNTNGTLTYSGGFLGGFSTTKRFGIATFRAIASGSAVVLVNSNSAAYNAQSQNMLSGTQGSTAVNIVIAPPAPAPTTPAPQKAPTPITTSLTGTVGGIIEGTTTATSSALGTTTQTAAVAAAGAWLTENWITVLVVLIVLAGTGFWVWRQKSGSGEVPPLS